MPLLGSSRTRRWMLLHFWHCKFSLPLLSVLLLFFRRAWEMSSPSQFLVGRSCVRDLLSSGCSCGVFFCFISPFSICHIGSANKSEVKEWKCKLSKFEKWIKNLVFYSRFKRKLFDGKNCHFVCSVFRLNHAVVCNSGVFYLRRMRKHFKLQLMA